MEELDDEIIRRNIRRKQSLSLREWLLFFFIPFTLDHSDTNFHSIEEQRFRRNDLKKKQAQMTFARILGAGFYMLSIWYIGTSLRLSRIIEHLKILITRFRYECPYELFESIQESAPPLHAETLECG